MYHALHAARDLQPFFPGPFVCPDERGFGFVRPTEPLSLPVLSRDQQLVSMGFNKSEAVQAFIACDKNVEMAANFLFENGTMGRQLCGQGRAGQGRVAVWLSCLLASATARARIFAC